MLKRILLVIIIVFNIYVFASVNTSAKDEIIRVSVDIPVKVVKLISDVSNKVEEFRIANINK